MSRRIKPAWMANHYSPRPKTRGDARRLLKKAGVRSDEIKNWFEKGQTIRWHRLRDIYEKVHSRKLFSGSEANFINQNFVPTKPKKKKKQRQLTPIQSITAPPFGDGQVGRRATQQEKKEKVIRLWLGGSVLVVIAVIGIVFLTSRIEPLEPFASDEIGILVLRIEGDTDNILQSRLIYDLNTRLGKKHIKFTPDTFKVQIDKIDSSGNISTRKNEIVLSENPPSMKIKIKASDEIVSESGGIDLQKAHLMAREIGERVGATLVLWGGQTGTNRFHPRMTLVSEILNFSPGTFLSTPHIFINLSDSGNVEVERYDATSNGHRALEHRSRTPWIRQSEYTFRHFPHSNESGRTPRFFS